MTKTMRELPGGLPLAKDACFQLLGVMHHAIDGQS